VHPEESLLLGRAHDGGMAFCVGEGGEGVLDKGMGGKGQRKAKRDGRRRRPTRISLRLLLGFRDYHH